MTPESPVARLVDAVRRRVRLERAMRFAAIVLPWLALSVAWWTLAGSWFAIAFAALGAATWTFRRHRRSGPENTPLLIERRVPSLENMVITAVELSGGQLRTTPAFREAILAEAAERAARVRPAAVVSFSYAAQLLTGAAAASLLLLALVAAIEPRAASDPGLAPREPVLIRENTPFTARLTPPAYLRLPSRELRNPERLEMVSGTVLEAEATGAAVRWVAEGATPQPAANTLRIKPDRGGFLAVEQGGRIQRVIPVTVRPDQVPRVDIERPGGDLMLAAAAPVAIAANATDDHALASTELRYTRVSGSGEQFEFASGVLPVSVDRTTSNTWSVRAELPLARMGASAGDTIVFRVAARDGRGEGGEGVSDAVMVEISARGGTVSAGAAIDPAEDKFALSQQMILLKLRRLHAGRRSLAAETLLDRSQGLAAEQRSVRALFVFMLGGDVEDEEVEAAHSHEIQEGRLEDTSRRDLTLAINLMSRVEQHLTAAETAAALPPAEQAVEAVQRAFGRRRYFLRTVPIRMRIDPSRRLTGDTSEAANFAAPGQSASFTSARLQAMEEMITLASRDVAAIDRPRLAGAAARLLALDPLADDIQRLAAEMQQVDPTSKPQVRAVAERALALLAAREQEERPGRLEREPAAGALRSAWADQWRGGGPR